MPRRHLPPRRPKLLFGAISPHPDELARTAGFRYVAGVDEAGRGPWAGPVVAAAVVLRRLPRAVRIDDSKRLTVAQRAAAYDAILTCADVGLGVVCADAIDRHNILQATLLAMTQAIGELSREPDLVLVDGSQAPRIATPCWPIRRGDQRSDVIACASIVAKVFRDRLMAFYHGLDPRYHFDRHKGYGTALHASRLAALGPSALHRLTFRPLAAGQGAHALAAAD